MQSVPDRLRRIALAQESAIQPLMQIGAGGIDASALDAKTFQLVRLGSLLAVGGCPEAYEWVVSLAVAAGATDEEIIGVLAAAGPVIGVGRVVSCAADLSLAMGHDVEIAFQRQGEPAG